MQRGDWELHAVAKGLVALLRAVCGPCADPVWEGPFGLCTLRRLCACSGQACVCTAVLQARAGTLAALRLCLVLRHSISGAAHRSQGHCNQGAPQPPPVPLRLSLAQVECARYQELAYIFEFPHLINPIKEVRGLQSGRLE